ncbi:MAG: sodium-translocating pyrophosphatase [Bacteroidales bacterium]|jgi:K(+)-stimulated pyrophosphate-energized sodium pump|nr:sodium-translocating pyrophosphatase [Bacteroidales bacterium]MDI9592475.1 sodium-translocating pyrophosphatase [Bacteroidota bacterium]HOF80222.1 sodium-translocating pyrophosphatase [Bacteroidales bacterium]HOR75653.1 sodium-translocating pyrophosphatase [Bacteroidales bacterium]HPL11068.1 sodium-translocating pyrophosphatase [Bacteroidales bacterium]
MEKIPAIFWLAPVVSVLALSFAYYFFKKMMEAPEGTDVMKKIATHVRKGARAYLRQQYKVVGIVFIIITVIFSIMAYGLGIQNPWVPFAFLTGGTFSGLAGYFGMKAATFASFRVANACRTCLDGGLRLAFRSGAVLGLTVVGLVLLDISLWFIVLNLAIPETTPGIKLLTITATMLTFGMGASTQALFARVGGGIYTKAADVGADLVGKIEANIPEDDPRNPATIADNVGDNVGDVAGMGADLFESFAGSILATSLLGAAAYLSYGEKIQINAVLAPLLIAAVGTLLSILGVFLVKTKEGATQKQLLRALGFGVNSSAFFIVIFSFVILYFLDIPNYVGLWGSIVVGLLAGIGIGQSTEYYTASAYKPTKMIAASSHTGPATVIISGVGIGLISTAIPLIIVVVAITLAYGFATPNLFSFDAESINYGLYGIGIASVGMLSTLGITLATDAYGPIADNAGGNAEMAHLGKEVRQRTDALDSLGNTTAATGKGFAIGSAALTALALLAAYFEEVKMMFVNFLGRSDELINGVPAKDAQFIDFIYYYDIHLMNAKVLVGVMIGVMSVFLFSGLTMNAVGRAAGKMVDEVRRQFREIKGIMEEKAEPDYARCVEISTKGAQREMLIPSLLALFIPIFVGLIFGVPAVTGLLIGTISAGFALAIFMANAGGAWDNAKKYIEEGNYGGKGSDDHKAAVIGDTVGDPFKDTSGPSLNILIKLMSMAAVVTAGVAVSYHLL